MKKIVILFILLLGFFNVSFGLSTDHFEITNDAYLQKGVKVKLKVKDIENISKIRLFVGKNELRRLSSSSDYYLFSFPDDYFLNSIENTIKAVILTKNAKFDKTYTIGKWPFLEKSDIIEKDNKQELELGGYFTGNCKLFLKDDKSWNLELRGNYAYAKIPENLDFDVNGGYVNCNGLKSNWLDFTINKAPYIRYVISEDKKEIVPGKTILLKGDNFKLNDDDKVAVLLNGKEIPEIFVQNKNTIKFTLPKQNSSNIKVQVKRNDFISNTITIKSVLIPYITKVNIVTKQGKNYFRLLGYFPKDLGNISVKYAGKTLTIDEANEDHIDVNYPQMTKDDNGNISCDYYITPSYFSVEIGGVKSNDYFYYKDEPVYITAAETPICANNNCSMKVYFNKSLSDGNIYVNGQIVSPGYAGRQAILYTDSLILKGDIKYIGLDCTISPKYYFDFTKNYKPIIREIVSKRKFLNGSRIDINGDKINNDGTNDNLNVKISFNPDVLDKTQKPIVGNYSITAFLKQGLVEGTKVNVSLSNKHGNSNGGYFVIGGKNKYMGNPYIKYVSYENGGEGGQKAIINGLNFSTRCSENEINFGQKVVYPDECDYNKLVFTIPSDQKVDTISVTVNGQKSEDYKLNSKIGGTLLKNKSIYVSSNGEGKVLDLQDSKQLNQTISFDFGNATSDIYVQKLTFKLTTDSEINPFYDFVLKINGDDNRYYFLNDQRRLIKGGDKNIGYIKRVNDGYEISFYNLFIPFNTEANKFELSFKISPVDAVNNSLYKISLPSQRLYYYNVYSKLDVLKTDLSTTLIGQFKLVNKPNICFDIESNFKHCALALKGKEVKFENSKPVSNTSNNQSNNTNTTNSSNTHNTGKHLTREEKIAKRLNLKTMELVNKLVKKYIVKQKRKYWGDKQKLKYVLEMFKGYLKMVKNTKEDYNSKIEYTKGLIEFAKAYMDFKRYLKTN